MSTNLPSLFVSEFSTNVNLLLQVKGSKLSGAVMNGSYVGKQASPVDQIGAVEALKVTDRFAAMGRVDATVDRRWVFPIDYDLPQLIDTFDKLKMISDVKSAYVQNAVYAMGRAKDAEIISAMFGTNKTGETGATSTVFSTATGQVVGLNTGGSNSNLNVAKLRAAKLQLMKNQVDLDTDPIYCAIDAVNHDALLNEVQIVSTDFNGAERPVLDSGRLTRFLGINFIDVELLRTKALGTDDQTTSTTSIQIPIWAKSGMHLGTWADIQASVTQRNDLRGIPWQVYATGTFGATRTEEKKIVKVWCAA